MAQTGRWTYPASKTAVVQLIRSILLNLAKDGVVDVICLCSELASFVTGTELAVDGGYRAPGPEATESVMNLMSAAVEAKHAPLE